MLPSMLSRYTERAITNISTRQFGCMRAPKTITKCDALVLGGGIGGASVSYKLAKQKHLNSVICLEKENCSPYHATGKAFGIFAESNARSLQNKLMTILSRPFFENPDEECYNDYIRNNFETPILQRTGLLAISSPNNYPYLYKHFGPNDNIKWNQNIQVCPQKDVTNFAPFLNKSELAKYAIYEPKASDFNTNLVYQHFIAGGNNLGVKYYFNESAVEINKTNNGNWEVLAYNAATNNIDRFESSILINCCGEWADDIAIRAGIKPINMILQKRNVMVFTFHTKKTKIIQSSIYRYSFPSEQYVDDENDDELPKQKTLWIGWISPDSNDIFHSCFEGNNGIFLFDKYIDNGENNNNENDENQEEMEIVLRKIAKYTTFKVKNVATKTAGIKCMSPNDMDMILGPSIEDKSFIWCAALSSYGIQTSPAYSTIVASLATNTEIPTEYIDLGIDVNQLLPSRLFNKLQNL